MSTPRAGPSYSGSFHPTPGGSSSHSASLSPQKRQVRALAEERLKASTPKNPISRKGILFRKGTKILAPGVGVTILPPSPGSAAAILTPAPKKSHKKLDPKEVEQRKMDRERMLKEQRRKKREERRERDELKRASGGGGGGSSRRVVQSADVEDEQEEEEESEGEKEDPVWIGFREDYFEIVDQLPLEVQRSFSLLKELEEQVQLDTSSLLGLFREYLGRRLGSARMIRPEPSPAPAPASPAAIIVEEGQAVIKDGNAEAGPSGYNGAASMDVDGDGDGDVEEAEVSVLIAPAAVDEELDASVAVEGLAGSPDIPVDSTGPADSVELSQPAQPAMPVLSVEPEQAEETVVLADATEHLAKGQDEADADLAAGLEEQKEEQSIEKAASLPGSPQLEPPSSDRDPMDIISDTYSSQSNLVPEASVSPEKRSPSVVPATPSPAQAAAAELAPDADAEAVADVSLLGEKTESEQVPAAAMDEPMLGVEELAPELAVQEKKPARLPLAGASSTSAFLNTLLNVPAPSDFPPTTTTSTLLPAHLPSPSPVPAKSSSPAPHASTSSTSLRRIHPNVLLKTRITSLISTLIKAGEEKVAIAKGTYDRVDRQCRSLDQALHAHSISMQMGTQIADPSLTAAAAGGGGGAGVSANGGGVKKRRTVVVSEDEIEEGEAGVDGGGGGERKRRRREEGGYKEEDADEEDGDGEYEDEEDDEEEVGGEGRKGKRKGRKGGGPAGQVVADALVFDDVDPNEPHYCYCNRVSFGLMIGCDNDDCAKEWFHYECVGLPENATAPDNWYCDDCRPADMPAVLLGPRSGGGGGHGVAERRRR